jgi:hypothetical protein
MARFGLLASEDAALSKLLAAAAVVGLGLTLAQVNDAGRAPRGASSADNSYGPVAQAAHPNVADQSPNAQSADDGHGRQSAHRSAGQPDYGDYGYAGYGYGGYDSDTYGPYATDAQLPSWVQGRWYRFPGFGDKRTLMPQPEGVWGR